MDDALSSRSDRAHPGDGPIRPGPSPGAGLIVDPAQAPALDRRFTFRHAYDTHPLMGLVALEALAERLQAGFQCRFMAPSTDPAVPFEHAPRPADGRTIREVFARLDEPGSWIALYDVQTEPAYRDFVWQVIADARSWLPSGERVLDVRGFIFVSAPPSVTPFHIDGENNFWMQIRGRKTIHVWDRNDPRVVADRDLERFILYRSLDAVRLDDAKRALGQAFDCGPGDGLYFPSTTPHMTVSTPDWVTEGDGVAVSIGVVFYTESTLREAHAHACNQWLRRIGWTPARPGVSRRLDAFKAPFGRLAVAAAERLRGYRPTLSFLRDANEP